MNLWIIAFPCLMFLGSLGTHLGCLQIDGDILG